MRYPLFDQLQDLVDRKLITRRPHPYFPLDIYNYTIGAQFMPINEWSEALKDCRGLILDRDGEIIGRAFRKFWNYSQVLGQIPTEPFTVWEKLDGSLGIVCYYGGERVVATRGSFESEQAKWLKRWFDQKRPDFYPSGETWLFEIIYPENRIVVDYGTLAEPVRLAVLAPDGVELSFYFGESAGFRKARQYRFSDFAAINADPQFAGAEGFVVRWESGLRAKLKLDEYTRLHRLITTCSTRTIWELLKTGVGVGELVDRVPQEFRSWVEEQAGELLKAHAEIETGARYAFRLAPEFEDRKGFAMWARQQQWPGLLFLLLDKREISETVWKLVEPKWATPFRKEAE